MTSQVDKPRDECGVVGVRAPGGQAGRIALDALAELQHRGQEAAGLASWTIGGDFCHQRRLGPVSSLSEPPRAVLAIGHTRYSTVGGRSIENCQPHVLSRVDGPIISAHNGTLTNAHETRAELVSDGVTFFGSTDSEVIGARLASTDLPTLDARVVATARALAGAFALVIGVGDCLYAARDPHGIRPLSVGETGDGTLVVASESVALVRVGCGDITEVAPGEVVRIDESGRRRIDLDPAQPATCAFEHAYFLREGSVLDGVAAGETRELLGERLAQSTDEKVDVIVGVPRSGLVAAKGYARTKGLPLTAAIELQGAARSFIEPTDELRRSAVLAKFRFVPELIYGRSVALVDDTIVRGNTMRLIAARLRSLGATEVHARIASPPVVGDCYLGVDILPTDAIATTEDPAGLTSNLGCSSIRFLSNEQFEQVLPGDRNCLGCFGGRYATDREGVAGMRLMSEVAR